VPPPQRRRSLDTQADLEKLRFRLFSAHEDSSATPSPEPPCLREEVVETNYVPQGRGGRQLFKVRGLADTHRLPHAATDHWLHSWALADCATLERLTLLCGSNLNIVPVASSPNFL
jgi:hypothetical protein